MKKVKFKCRQEGAAGYVQSQVAGSWKLHSEISLSREKESDRGERRVDVPYDTFRRVPQVQREKNPSTSEADQIKKKITKWSQ